jgi:hypothetical protein
MAASEFVVSPSLRLDSDRIRLDRFRHRGVVELIKREALARAV